MSLSFKLLEKGLVPDGLIRIGIRSRLKAKLAAESAGGAEAVKKRQEELVETLRSSPISVHTDSANAQHYEIPADFFQMILGRRMKYSSGLWPNGVVSIDGSEEAMLALTVERARIRDGESVLELGCGWGSLSLYMAERFPGSRITALSNSKSQKEFIDREAEARGLKNLRVLTAEMSRFETDERFDRIVSVEMFEHMRNYERLFEKVAGFLKPEGTLFVHIFAHREYGYLYQETDPEDWIAKYFFTGGTMPSERLFYSFQKDLKIKHHWKLNGTHYAKTCRAWLSRMDSQRSRILPILERTYGAKDRDRWFVYWRVFFMACEELFAYGGGEEWFVSHYLFGRAEAA